MFPERAWRGNLLAAGALALAAAAVVLAFRLAHDDAAERLAARAGAAALTRAQAVESVLATQRAVAAILSDDALVRAALHRPEALEAVSRKLERLREETGSTVIYLLDRSGVAVASSNWGEDPSFVGEDYSFREYFAQALTGGTALQFALGSVSRRPGLYLSHDIREGAGIPGVVVVKTEFAAVEAAWAQGLDATYVTDETGRVLIASDPAARFGALPPDAGRIVATRPVSGAEGWSLTLFAPAREAVEAGAVAAGGMLGLEVLAGLLAFGLLRSRRRAAHRAEDERRYRADLERAVEDRTRDLTAEMRERRMAEERLARMQADLVQANKLATLGQVTAGLAHEISQPLATIRLLAENGVTLFRTAPDEARDNLTTILRMSGRIAQITERLRGFSRKATGQVVAVELRDAIEASLLLTASRRRAEGARLVTEGAEPGIRVLAEAVRLEQILVNLIQNAQEAVAGRPDPEIRITVEARDDRVVLSVADNGPGLAPGIAAQLFTPFATSKTDGLGLGLVIAKDIARDLGGELSADPPGTGRGAVFRLRLLRA